jgi:FtsH-binding integral membrane protein
MRELHDRHDQVQATAHATEIDQGLRRYMLGVYNKVALGLLVAGAVAYATSAAPWLRDLLFTTTTQGAGAPRVGLTFLGSMTAFAPVLVLVFFAGPALSKPSAARSGALYWSVVSLVGASLGVLFLTFTGGSIAITLAVTALGFAGLSLLGYTTQKDLSGLRGFLIMGLIGLVLSLAANLFLNSPVIEYVTGVVGVLIFAGLIAYDGQRLKMSYHQLKADGASLAVASDLGALSLFINFVNLFQFLLMAVSGQRR